MAVLLGTNVGLTASTKVVVAARPGHGWGIPNLFNREHQLVNMNDNYTFGQPDGTANRDISDLLDKLITPHTSIYRSNAASTSIRVLVGANRGGGPAGEYIGRYQDDFYHRIHVDPPVLDLGNLISTQTRNLTLWNAYFHPVTLTDVQMLNGDGINFLSPVAYPYNFGTLQELVYEVSVTTSGPPAIVATVQWTIDDEAGPEPLPYDLPISITGNRVIAMYITPDFKQGLEATLEWKTDIIRSYNALEQRAMMRNKPRLGHTYSYSLFKGRGVEVENLLWAWQSRLFAVPHWEDTVLSTQNLFVGQTGISVPTDGYGYAVNSLLFVTDGEVFEMQEIEAITTGLVTLKKGLDRLWGMPTVIGPASFAKIAGDFSASFNRLTSNVATTSITFDHDPITTNVAQAASTATDLYLSSEILYAEPNWKDGMDLSFSSDAVVLDYETGAFAISAKAPIPDIMQSYEWFLKDRASILNFKKFVERRKGRLNGFWMPSWSQDFQITQTVPNGALGFTAKENNYGLLVKGAAGRKHVMILLNDGTRMIREISAASIAANQVEVEVVLTTGVSKTFFPADVKICCLVGWYRQFNDKVKMDFADRNFATVKMSLLNILQ